MLSLQVDFHEQEQRPHNPDSRAVWQEYEELLERARQQFGLLRELPLYGRVHWEDCFQKVSLAAVVPVVAVVRSAVQAALCAGMSTWGIQRVSSIAGLGCLQAAS